MFHYGNNKRKMSYSDLVKPSKKRRGNAAIKERERLQIFNDALEQLQSIMPLRLPKSKKLHKKQTVQLATKYITFLWECLEGKQDWENRHRFMWLVDKDDGDVIDAIDAAYDNGPKTQTREEGQINNFESNIENIYVHGVHSFAGLQVQNTVQNENHVTNEDIIEADSQPHHHIWTTETTHPKPQIAIKCEPDFVLSEKIFGFIQDYDILPEIAVDDVTNCFEHYSRVDSFDSNCSPLSATSDDSAYGTDLSSNKTP